MNPESINKRAELARNSQEEINRLVEDYKPFIAACVQRATGRYMHYGEDDELSIGLMAFVEAVQSHDSSKGNFLSFAQTVIQRRLIDHHRKERKHSCVVSLQGHYPADPEDELDLSSAQAVEQFQSDQLGELRRVEIEEIQKELALWDISFADLVRTSPKQQKMKDLCGEILDFILSKPELAGLMKEKKYLPVAEIEKGLKLHRKKIERIRKYIIAMVVISTGDYQYIREYVRWGGKKEERP